MSRTIGHAVASESKRLVRQRLQHCTIPVLGIALTLVLYCAVNYAKFRTFDGIPLRYYEMYQQKPERMQITAGKQIHPENILTTAVNYFGLSGLRFERQFPWRS